MKTSNPIFSRWGFDRTVGQAGTSVRQPVGASDAARPTVDHLTNPYQ